MRGTPTAARSLARAAAALLLVALLAPACEKIDRNMWDNPAFKAQEEPVRPMPPDSVPTKERVQVPPIAEAVKIANPVKPDEAALRKGKELFGIFCVPCHGSSGAGDGPVGKKFVPPPADLRPSGPFAQVQDGVLFVIVSNGAGRMPAFRADLSTGERWRIIAYIRTLR